MSFKEGKLFAFALATEKDQFIPVDQNNQTIGEEVMEVNQIQLL